MNDEIKVAQKPIQSMADVFRKGAAAKAEATPPAEKPAETKAESAPEVKTEAVKNVETPAVQKEAPKVEGDPSAGLKEAISKKSDPSENLAALRKKWEDAESRAQELERKARELESKVPTDYEKLKNDLEYTTKELEKVHLQASPRFKEKYEKPMTQALDSIKKTLNATDVDVKRFMDLVQQPESKDRNAALSDLTENLDKISFGKITTAMAQYESLRDSREAELSNPDDTYQKIRQEQELTAQQKRSEQVRVMENVLGNATKQVPWFKPIEGQEAWNQRITDVQSRAKSYWNPESPHTMEELADVTFKGSIYPLMQEALQLAHAETERLNAELAELRGSTPGTKVGVSAEVGGKGEAPKGRGSAVAAFRNKMSGNA